MRIYKAVTILLALFALIVGTTVFLKSEFRPSTLNIDATSMENGIGTVTFEGSGYNAYLSRKFEIIVNQGLKKLYVIELPPGKLSKVTISPQVHRGSFGIDRIILANDTVSYSWDENGACSQQNQVSGFHKKEPCVDGAPLLVTKDNSTIVISKIPETGFTNTFYSRILRTVIIAVCIMLGGVWLMWPSNIESKSGTVQFYGVRLSWLLIEVIFIWQLYWISIYSVDVPNVDEWMAYFWADGLINGLTWSWLFGFHNEHRIVLTKLMAWLNLKLFDLNFELQVIINYFIFGGLLVAISVFKNKITGSGKFVFFTLFLIFLLSPIAYENHIWAFQSQFHLVLLFSILALFYAYRSELNVGSALTFCLYATLAIYSFSAGVIFVATYILCITVYIVAGINGGRITLASGSKFLLIIYVICGTSLYLWFLGYEAPTWASQKVLPNDFRFWIYFLNSISFGFGFNQLQILPGLICLILVALPLIMLLMKNESRWQPSTWLLLSAVLGIFAVLSAVSVGRAVIYLDTPKRSAYAEIAFLLVPYAALGWWLAIENKYKKIAMLSFLWIFCFVMYWDDWSSEGYAEFKQGSIYDLQRVENYYSGQVSDCCPVLATPAELERVRKLGVKFTRQFMPVGVRLQKKN